MYSSEEINKDNMKNKQKKRYSRRSLIEVVVGIFLVGIIAVLSYTVCKQNSEKPSLKDAAAFMESLPGLITFAPVAYSSDSPAALTLSSLSDYAKVPGLVDALKIYESKKPCSGIQGIFKQHVLGVTEDQSQALIGSGCGGTGMLRSFMVKQNDKWVKVSSWDPQLSSQHHESNFSALLDTPSCAIVEKYDIQKSIAPVCFMREAGKSSLFTGDIANYNYTLR